jgi:predicted regulator of Ras-like GTPase activity (Roadblock/LC7/MglB family)
MATLPQLIEEDIKVLNEAMSELLSKSDSTCSLIIDKGGFVITQCGDTDPFDTVTLAALAAASYAATESIAHLVSETNFSSVYQQGEMNSLLVHNVDESCLLAVVFRAQISVGAVKYYATDTLKKVARQLNTAQRRTPDAGFDLSELNLADPTPLFIRKSA